jgi:UDP-glucose 4-epimerase
MKALVTGGAGFIGSTLVDRLLADGGEVVVVDNLATGSLENLGAAREHHADRLEFHEVDITEPEVVELVHHTEPEVVFHLAAQADVRVSVADPAMDATVNVVGGLHVLEGSRRAGARKLVFASSGGTIYGDPDPSELPIDETHPQSPVSPYGVAKKAFGDYLAAYQALHGFDYTSLALANVYGPRQDPHGEAGVVAIFAGRLLAGDDCTIFGTGKQTRDFVYVDDVADAFVRASERASCELLNIGTGVETSVNRLFAVMAEASGRPNEPVYAPARAGELDRSALDPAKAAALLGWAPTTSLEAGVTAVLDWFRSR